MTDKWIAVGNQNSIGNCFTISPDTITWKGYGNEQISGGVIWTRGNSIKYGNGYALVKEQGMEPIVQ